MGKKLTAYFSATGTTKKTAEKIAQVSGSDLFEIRPSVSYSNEDLDWRNKKSRSSLEMSDRTSRPEIAEKMGNIGEYDTLYLGFPIWWYREPSIIDTFLEQYDFSGIKITIFATAGGSDFGSTKDSMKGVSPEADITEGIVFKGPYNEDSVSSWAKNL